MKVRHVVPAVAATTAVLVLGLGALSAPSGAQPFFHHHHPTTTTTHRPTTTTRKPTTTTTAAPTTTTTFPTTTTAPTTTVGPTTTTAGSGGTGGNCASPTFSSSEASATINEDPGPVENWWVNNDAWSGSHGPQTINVCSQQSWDAVSTQPNVQGQVETYPDTEYDVGGRDTPSKETIAQFGSITSTFSESYPSAGAWDAAYDLWTNNWLNETMVWNQYAGAQSFWFDQGTPVTIGGVQYHFVDNGSCEPVRCSGAGTNTHDELMFIMVNQETSGSVDLLAVLQWEVANHYVNASDVPTQLEYGVEICDTSGQETFPMTGLTFSLS